MEDYDDTLFFPSVVPGPWIKARQYPKGEYPDTKQETLQSMIEDTSFAFEYEERQIGG